jgi:hypothetical protein
MTLPADTFACPACGQQFAWSPAHAGRKLGCGCGRVITVPIALEPAPQSYDLKEDADLPAPPPGELSPDAAGAEIKATPVLAYDSKSAKDKQRLGEEFWEHFRDFWLPVGLIGLSLAIVAAVSVLVIRNTFVNAPEFIMSVSIRLGWDVCMTLVVGVFLAWLLDMALGELPTALLKLVSIAMIRFAIWSLFGLTSRYIVGDILGFLCSLPVLLFLFSYLFEMDFRDTFFAASLLTLLRWVSYFGMWRLLP